MRPVDKGVSPYASISCYSDALPYLEEKNGIYCSYCEMPIKNGPHVEHKESKNSGGSITGWSNLLLSCIYCNSTKREKIKAGQANFCIWPDMDNTFLAYVYENGLPALNKSLLTANGQHTYDKAKKLFDIVVLDNIPSHPKVRDRRWKHRMEAFGLAANSHVDWLEMKGTEYRHKIIQSIKDIASNTGFFSTWMMVFKNEAEIKNELINVFTGTAKNCFDINGAPIRRNGGII
jgi:hypothetical protein